MNVVKGGVFLVFGILVLVLAYFLRYQWFGWTQKEGVEMYVGKTLATLTLLMGGFMILIGGLFLIPV